VAGVVGGTWLAEDAAFEGDDGVSGNDDGRADGAGGDQLGLSTGKALDEVVRSFAGVRCFVNGGGEDRERDSSGAKNFSAADGSGGEDQFHHSSWDFWWGRILQGKRGDSLCFGPAKQAGELDGCGGWVQVRYSVARGKHGER
jgi:hypothetical protein